MPEKPFVLLAIALMGCMLSCSPTRRDTRTDGPEGQCTPAEVLRLVRESTPLYEASGIPKPVAMLSLTGNDITIPARLESLVEQRDLADVFDEVAMGTDGVSFDEANLAAACACITRSFVYSKVRFVAVRTGEEFTTYKISLAPG
jgi:hypothetical protein